MRAFTAARDARHARRALARASTRRSSPRASPARAEHVLDAGAIPVVRTDRGGQVTYHGPGQVVAYPLVDLRRLGIYVKEYVFRLEQARDQDAGAATASPAIACAARRASTSASTIRSATRCWPPADRGGDPFAGLGKIAALGIKVSRHCAYHGVALNVAMDLRPFERIDPCGYAGLATVDLSTIGVRATWDEAASDASAPSSPPT